MKRQVLWMAGLYFAMGQFVFAQSSVQGRVTFSGTAPEPAQLPVTRDQGHCGEHKPNETVVVSRNGGLANVVVSIENAPKVPMRPGEITVANSECRFVPHVSAATVNSTLVVRSDDPILHNTHTFFSDGSTFFNIAFPFKGGQIKRPLAKPQIVSFKCDVGHVWMSAWIHVFPHPFFAVTDGEGNFRIAGLPPGQYTVKFWHEKLGTKTLPADSRAATSVNVMFQ